MGKTTKTEATINQDTFAMKNESNLMTLHDMIMYAHDSLMNRKALSKTDFTDKGMTEQDFEQWEAYVEEMRQQVIVYNKLSQDRNAKDQDISVALGHVWAAWRAVLKQGTESEYNKHFFVRENDAHLIAEWAGLTAITTARGKQWTTASKTNFRRNVETAIGIRMTGNKMLSDDGRDLIQAYEGAQKTIKNMTDALNDKIEKGNKTSVGYRTILRGAEKALEDMQKTVSTLDISDEAKKSILSKFEFAVLQAKASVTDAEKKIKDAQAVIDEKQKDYDKLIATLKSVGDAR